MTLVRWAVAAMALAAAAFTLLAGTYAAFGFGPGIVPRQSLPDDVAALTAATWETFERAFSARSSCLIDVELELVTDVPGGAAGYLATERLIRIEIPTSPRRYVESLTHELAHHLDTVCGAERAIGVAFREAQGLASDAPWASRAQVWEERPREQFAEAVVEYVTGDRYTHSDIIDVSDEAVDIVRHWGTGTA